MPKVSLPKYPDIEEGTLCPHNDFDHIVWKSQYGDIFICQMTNNHLRNTYNFLNKVINRINENSVLAFNILPMFQGEMAIDSIESDIARLENDFSVAKMVQDRILKILVERS